MRISVVRPTELGAAEIGAWHAMQDQSDALANPFLCPEFAMAVGRCRPDARVAVLTEESGPAGFFPFERSRLGVGRPIGAGLSDCQGLVHAPGADWDPGELLRGCGIAVWHFDHLVSGQAPFAAYSAASAASPVMDLADGYPAYIERVKARSPRFRSDVARKARKLEREAGPLKFVIDEPDIEGLRTLMRWKSDQYRRTGRTDRFDRPWIVELVEKLLSCRKNGFAGLLSMLYADGRPVAGHFGLVHGGVLAEWFPAYDASFARYSPGLVQLLAMAQDAAGLGIRSIDLGKGAQRYKDELKSYDLTVAEGTVTDRSALAIMHRARLAPPRWAVRTIRRHRPLYVVADQVLRRYGRLRRRLSLRPCAHGSCTTRVRSARYPQPRVRSSWSTGRCHRRGQGSCSSGCWPAASAGPTCIWRRVISNPGARM
jgi:CelD/BcsL family acetyltransferase involved in cellulose biosynthesis